MQQNRHSADSNASSTTTTPTLCQRAQTLIGSARSSYSSTLFALYSKDFIKAFDTIKQNPELHRDDAYKTYIALCQYKFPETYIFDSEKYVKELKEMYTFPD